MCYGVVAPLYEQAAVWARRMVGDAAATYAGSVVCAQLKVSGMDVFSAGEIEPAHGEALVLHDPAAGVYRRLNVSGDRVVGAVLVGDVADGPGFSNSSMPGRMSQRPARCCCSAGPWPSRACRAVRRPFPVRTSPCKRPVWW